MAIRPASLVLAAMLAPAASWALSPVPHVPCAFGAFIGHVGPAGLAVHAGPSENTPRLAVLPSPTVVVADTLIPGEDAPVPFTIYPEVEVTAFADGWAKIRNARENDALLTEFAGRPARPLYTAEGWVRAAALTVKTQAEAAYIQPSASATVAFRFADGETTLDHTALQEQGRLMACQGEWAEMDYGPFPPELAAELAVSPSQPSVPVRVWVNRICGVQETSCDGV